MEKENTVTITTPAGRSIDVSYIVADGGLHFVVSGASRKEIEQDSWLKAAYEKAIKELQDMADNRGDYD
jgi:hypothetical protein